ncbi:MAG: ribonuclease J [Alphaproteobacteria bacterium]|nr:MAG: ribonuclease J [Alphaproteobacteria bacterium]
MKNIFKKGFLNRRSEGKSDSKKETTTEQKIHKPRPQQQRDQKKSDYAARSKGPGQYQNNRGRPDQRQKSSLPGQRRDGQIANYGRSGGGNRRRRDEPKEMIKFDDYTKIPTPKENDFFFLPIGGSGEIGMNVNLYGHNNQWIMVDLGITFADEPYGFDLVTANLDIIKSTSIGRLLKGVIITHAHEDHIGGVHEIWPYFKFHVYVTKFSKAILERKLENKPYAEELMKYYVHEIPAHGRVTVGDFEIQYLDITHSIPESNALTIKTKSGTVFHTGDWKLDMHPGIGEPVNADRYKNLAKQNILAMVCDSTNAMSKGRSGSEEVVAKNFDKLFAARKRGRIAVTCFASNIGRVKIIADLAKKHGRKVCLLGRSLHKMSEAADQCQFPLHVDQFISDVDASRLKPEKVLYICTGSQGDLNAALARIARGVHRVLRLGKGDIVYFSSKTIPGNERRINLLQNNLTRLGVDIVTDRDIDIHVSGHPNQDELKDMYNWVKPSYVIPVHGEFRHLYEHAKFAKSCGFDALAPENGTLIDLKKREILKRYSIGRIVLDGNRFINYESSIVKERRLMGTDGAVFVSIKGTNFVFVSSHGLLEENFEEYNKRIRDSVRKIVIDNETAQNKTLKEARIIDRVKQLSMNLLSKSPEVKVHFL